MARPSVEPNLTDISGPWEQLLKQRNLPRPLRDELGVQAESDPDELANVGKLSISHERLRRRRYRQSRGAPSVASLYRHRQIRV